ncbi:unnamed protein product, partial [marine sediment metagenome]
MARRKNNIPNESGISLEEVASEEIKLIATVTTADVLLKVLR